MDKLHMGLMAVIILIIIYTLFATGQLRWGSGAATAPSTATAAPVTAPTTAPTTASVAKPPTTTAPSAPTPSSSSPEAYFAANPWEKVLPSGSKTVMKFTFTGPDVKMSTASYNASGAAVGEPVGATATWTPSGTSVNIKQGANTMILARGAPRTLSLSMGPTTVILTAPK
jgi:hypothetical protein